MTTSTANVAPHVGNSNIAAVSVVSNRRSLPPDTTMNPQRLSAMTAQELYAKLHANRSNSEVLGAHYISPEAQAIDRWFEDLSKYENTLEQMAKAKLDESFKEELVAIEKWFTVLSTPERTTALYTLLQHANPVQIRFFLQVLSQMAENNPMPTPANGTIAASNGSINNVKPTSSTTPSPAVSPRPSSTGSPVQRTDSDHDSANTTSRSRRPLYERHSAPQDGSLGVNLLAFQASMNAAHNRITNNTLSSDANTDYSSTAGNGYGDKKILSQSNTSSASSKAQSPSMRPRTPDHATGAGGERSPNQRSTSIKRVGIIQTAGLGIISDPILLSDQQQQGAANGYRLSDTPLIAPRTASLVDDEACVVAAEVANLALAPTSAGFATPRSSATCSRPITPMSMRSPASVSSCINQTTASQRSNISPPQNLLDISPPRALQQAGTPHFLPHQCFPPSNYMHPAAGWGHIDLAKTKGVSAYAASDYSDDQDALGMWGSNFGLNGLDYYTEGGMRVRMRNGSIGSVVSSHKEKGKIPESFDLQLLNDIPSWLRSLRLHKYTSVFEGMKINDLIHMSDEDLVAKGITALGARRKLTKVFDVVKQHLEAKQTNGWINDHQKR